MKDKNLEEWNHQVLMLNQALIGAISDNFRMVVLARDRERDEWVLKFYINDEVEEDMEEIDDVACQFSAFQDGPVGFRIEIVSGRRELPKTEGERVIFLRKSA